MRGDDAFISNASRSFATFDGRLPPRERLAGTELTLPKKEPPTARGFGSKTRANKLIVFNFNTLLFFDTIGCIAPVKSPDRFND